MRKCVRSFAPVHSLQQLSKQFDGDAERRFVRNPILR